MRALRAGFAALLVLALAAGPAGASVVRGQVVTAAPDYLSSEPENGAMLDEAPDQVSVTFDEPIDPESSLSISDECGRKIDDGNVTVNPNSMSVGIAQEPSGTYTVTYFVKGLGGVTGQQTGTFSFMVHHGKACDGGDGSGHPNHPNPNHPDPEHPNHPDKDHPDEHDDDEGHDPDHMDGGGTHDTGTHGGAAGHDTNGGHAGMEHGNAAKHGSRHGEGHGKNHRNGNGGDRPDEGDGAGDGATLAGAEDFIPVSPNGAAVLTALGLSLAMGAVGGWFLRMSGAR